MHCEYGGAVTIIPSLRDESPVVTNRLPHRKGIQAWRGMQDKTASAAIYAAPRQFHKSELISSRRAFLSNQSAAPALA
jgi:hypothetical protein